MTREEYVLNAIRDKAREVLPEGSLVRLFGSRARNEAHEDSDWDVHILVPGEEKLPLKVISDLSYPFAELGWELDEEINVLMHSFKGWEKRSFLPLYKNIEKDAKII